MKKTKRIGVSALAIAIAAASFSGMSANAKAPSGTTNVPEGYVAFDDQGTMKKVFTGQDADVAYAAYYKAAKSGTDINIVFDYMFNYTELNIKNATAFNEIYKKYQGQLGFDHYSESLGNPDVGKNVLTVTMYDNLNADGKLSKNPEDFQSKRDLVIKMYRELLEADALDTTLYQSYYPSYAYLMEGQTDNSVHITQIQDGETDALTEIAAKYDTDTVVKAFESETELTCTYEISSIGNIETSVQIAKAIEQNYQKAAVEVPVTIQESAQTNTLSSDIVDLSTAQIYGDPDNDAKVTPDDAYQTLCYFAKTSVNADAAFTDNSDETKEAAAFAAADVNGDGIVDADDAYLILRYYAAESVSGTPSWD